MVVSKGPHPTVVTIDCQYLGPRRFSAYLILEDDRVAFVDNNTKRALPILLRALKECGYTPEQVTHAFVTHCHLDHAGGSAALLKVCPNASLWAHPKAARHLIDPSRLIAGAKMVYGETIFQDQFAAIEPCDPDRVVPVGDGETLEFGSRTLRFFHTLGHASHHVCIYDPLSNGVFAGDNFGMIYEELQHGDKPYCFCVATPVEFDPAESRVSVQRIVDTGAQWAYVGHFGPHAITEARTAQLLKTIDMSDAIIDDAARSGLDDAALHQFVGGRVQAATEEALTACGLALTEDVLQWVRPDIALNTSGILAAAIKRRHPQ